MAEKGWYNKAFVSISALNGNEVSLQAKTTSLGWTGGLGDIEGIDTFAGKITRISTPEDIEITLEGIPVSIRDFDWLQAGLTNPPTHTSTGAAITSSTTGTKYRVVFLWTNQTGVTSATQAITGTNEAYRRAWADCYVTSLEGSMDAGDNLKATITFKTTAEDEDGDPNWAVWSKDTTSGTLAALNSYTSSTTKW